MLTEKPFVYVLRSSVDRHRYYSGVTSNVNRRVETHNSGGSQRTKAGRP
jgi:predicted GIY-YIG superfamily endonuclease